MKARIWQSTYGIMELHKEQLFRLRGEELMAIQHDGHREKISLEEFFALLERDPDNRYELIGGYP